MGCSTVFDLELVEALLGYLFRKHLLVNLHNYLMMHIPGMGKGRVRDPYGEGTLGFLSLSRVTPGLYICCSMVCG